MKKHFLHIEAGVSTGFEKSHPKLVSEFLPLFWLYKFLINHISFVSNQYTFDILPAIGVLFQLTNPVTHIIEAVLIGAIICKHHSLSIFKVILSDISISLLASCIPNLKLYILTIELYVFNLEVYTYC